MCTCVAGDGSFHLERRLHPSYRPSSAIEMRLTPGSAPEPRGDLYRNFEAFKHSSTCRRQVIASSDLMTRPMTYLPCWTCLQHFWLPAAWYGISYEVSSGACSVFNGFRVLLATLESGILNRYLATWSQRASVVPGEYILVTAVYLPKNHMS